jgi:Zn-dependent protease with chaperone function
MYYPSKTLYFAALLLVFGVTSPGAHATVDLSREWSAPAQPYDCSGKAAAMLLPGAFSVQLADISTPSKDAEDLLEVYGKAACKAAYSAWALTGFKKAWLPGMRFVMVDTVQGDDYQAFHTGITGHMVVATRRAVKQMGRSSFADLPLVWTLGHELGHGLHWDEGVKKGIGAAGAIVATVGGLAVGVTRGAKAGIGTAVAGAALATCGKGLYGIKAEKDADRFGFRVLLRAGVDYARAQEATIATLNSKQEGTGNPCGTGDISAHPSTESRVKNIEGIRDTFDD